MKEYIALFEYVTGEEGFGVIVPDIPGFSSGGDTCFFASAAEYFLEGKPSHRPTL